MPDPMTVRPLVAPLVALVLWTWVMWVWLYATRIPAIRRSGVRLPPETSKEQLNALLPAVVRWKADNYNHLLEQPVLFYALVLTLAFLGAADAVNVALAWGYVALRVVHSLIQALVNVILWRFGVFVASSVLLFVLTLRAAAAVFGG